MPSKLKNMIIRKDRSMHDALALIDKNAKGALFVVDKLNKICGVVTDGDIRRAILNNVAKDERVAMVMNRSFVAFNEDSPLDEIMEKIGYKYKCIPIVNSKGEVVDYYSLNLESNIPIAKPHFNGNELKYVTECITTNWISSQGKFVNRFEEEFAEYIGTKYAVATSNGTTALHLALETLGIKAGDEVIVPSLTFIATANCVSYTGAKPVFVDCELDTWNMDPKKIEDKVTNRTKAIIPVHLYGQPAKMDEIMSISKKHKLYVIEDAAEAHGAEYKGRRVGSIAHIGIFSFFGNKIITTGEGGMLVTNDSEIYQKARVLRDHGMDPQKKYWYKYIGFNYRMTNLQAAVGCAQLERIENILQKKREIAAIYNQYLSDKKTILLPPEHKWSKNVYWMYSMVLRDDLAKKNIRDTIIECLKQSNIECRPFFYPIHKLPPYFVDETLGIAEYLSQNGINVPSYVDIEVDDIKKICEQIRELINRPLLEGRNIFKL